MFLPAVPDPPRQVQSINVSDSSIFISWISGFDGGAKQSYQIRYRRLIEDRYNYQDILPGVEYFHLENLRSATEYLFNLRSNNSHYLSPWSKDVSATTLPYRSFSFASLFSSNSRREYSWLTLSVVLVAALFIIGINGLVVLIVLRKNRRSCTSSDNSSTTGTNETETNTVDLFQPTTTNFVADRRLLANIHQYPFDNYQNYDEDEIHRPFVSSYSSNNLTRFPANDQQGKQFLFLVRSISSCFSRKKFSDSRHSSPCNIRDHQSNDEWKCLSHLKHLFDIFRENRHYPMIIFDCITILCPVWIELK